MYSAKYFLCAETIVPAAQTRLARKGFHSTNWTLPHVNDFQGIKAASSASLKPAAFRASRLNG
ncbi:MAG: hypothetical protein ACREX0_15940, partial [Noviherbaspirillum sp.]